MTNEELVARIQAGESDLIERLWWQCYGFIRQQAIRWAKAWESRSDFDVDDLTQAGYIALCAAVNAFQENRGIFIAVLSYYLKTEFSEVARCHHTAQLKEPLNGALSLDAPVYKDLDNEVTLGETIPVSEPGFEVVEDAVFNQRLAKLLRQAAECLPEKQRMAIEMHYLQEKPYAEVAKTLDCSISYSQQCSKDGLRNMKQGAFAPAMSEMLYGDRNYYRHTSFSAWKHSGCSSPEWELMRKEDALRTSERYNLATTWNRNIV